MMKTVYQYDAEGFYTGECTAYSGRIPHGTTEKKPSRKKNYIPRWTGQKWVQVQNHMGEAGYVNGEYIEIKTYGPLPKGFSTEVPVNPENEIQEQISEYRTYLADTDYISLKLAEAIAAGDDLTDLMQKYSVELAERNHARQQISFLESNL